MMAAGGSGGGTAAGISPPALSCIHSTRCGEIVAALSNLMAPHEMAVREPSRGIDATVRYLRLPSCSLSEIHYGAAVRIHSQVPQGRYFVHMVTEGESRIGVGGNDPAVLRPGMVRLSPPGAQVSIEFGRESRHLTASLQAQDLPFHKPGADIEGGGIVDAATIRGWRELVELVFNWTDMGPQALGSAAPHFDALLGGFFRDAMNGPRQMAPLLSPSLSASSGPLPWYLVQARRIIAEQVRASCDSIQLGDVAARVGVGVRTLQSGFRRFAGRSFLEELRMQRLAELDLRLAQAGPEDDVTTIMQACGIVSMGRFAAYYREHYGTLPSARLRRRNLS